MVNHGMHSCARAGLHGITGAWLMPPRSKLFVRPTLTEIGFETHRLLLVEPGGFLTALARDIPHSGAMVLCQYVRLSHALIGRIRPDCVAAPLFSPVFDIVELTQILKESGYQGALMVISPPLPDGPMVLRELQDLAPRMAVRLIEHEAGVLRWAADQG